MTTQERAEYEAAFAKWQAFRSTLCTGHTVSGTCEMTNLSTGTAICSDCGKRITYSRNTGKFRAHKKVAP